MTMLYSSHYERVLTFSFIWWLMRLQGVASLTYKFTGK